MSKAAFLLLVCAVWRDYNRFRRINVRRSGASLFLEEQMAVTFYEFFRFMELTRNNLLEIVIHHHAHTLQHLHLSLAALGHGGARHSREGAVFSNVYSVYEALAMVGAAVLMAASRLIMRFLAAPDYFSAWHYAPVLTLGTALGCLGAFFATVYMVEKRSAATLATTAAGAAVNLAGKALLIPVWGAMGAAVALLYVRPLIKAARSGFREILPRRHR